MLWRMKENMLELRRGGGGVFFFEDGDGAKMEVRWD
jgi:hypothetical protein